MGARDQPNVLPSGADMADVPFGFDHERMDEVLRIKAQANSKFKESDYFSAKCLYSGALEMLERCCLHLKDSDTVWEGIKNNMALCDLKRSEWTRVIEATTEILTRNPSNTKALYRRGVAKAGHGKYPEAQRDLRLAVELEPENVDARQKLVEISQQLKSKRVAEKDQAEKMRGFLHGERLDDTVAVSKDGGVRKMHGNENAPLYSSWIKRAWLAAHSATAGVVTAHIVLKTPSGKEVLNTRKPPGAGQQQPPGPQGRPAEQPPEPARWVVDDRWGGVYHAWNAAIKSMQLHELARFEIARHTLGPSVADTIDRCIEKWMTDTPSQSEMTKHIPQDVQASGKRRQALQILGFAEQFCMELEQEPNATLNMEVELLEVNEFVDLHSDGQKLVQVFREGKKRLPSTPVVTDLTTVTAHFRVSKLLSGYSLKDTRMGLAMGGEGMVMRRDKTKEHIEFIIGEEEAPTEAGEFVPPSIGRCLLLPPGGVVEGMHFEVILRDGVPIREMERSIYNAYTDGAMGNLPDTTGPVCIRVEVESVLPACAGPSTPGWKALDSIRRERQRADELTVADEGRHLVLALKRWRRIIEWLESVLNGLRWKLQDTSAVGGGSMYDLEWEDESEAPEKKGDDTISHPPTKSDVAVPAEFDDALIGQLQPSELSEWALAHAAAAKILKSSNPGLCELYARRAVQASTLGKVPAEVEISARAMLADLLLSRNDCNASEALELVKVAQALDPTSTKLRDLAAIALQKDSDHKTVGMKAALKVLKLDVGRGLESDDTDVLRRLLEEIDALPLTWDAVNETAIGKEVGKCAKHADTVVSELAKTIIGKLHKLAKEQRPLWVR